MFFLFWEVDRKNVHYTHAREEKVIYLGNTANNAKNQVV